MSTKIILTVADKAAMMSVIEAVGDMVEGFVVRNDESKPAKPAKQKAAPVQEPVTTPAGKVDKRPRLTSKKHTKRRKYARDNGFPTISDHLLAEFGNQTVDWGKLNAFAHKYGYTPSSVSQGITTLVGEGKASRHYNRGPVTFASAEDAAKMAEPDEKPGTTQVLHSFRELGEAISR